MRAYLAAGIIGMFLLAIGAIGLDARIASLRKAADKAGYERAKGEQAASDNKALKEALADVKRLNTELQGITSDAKRQRDAAATAGAAARDAGGRLRAAETRLAAALAAGSCPDATTAPGSAATNAALDLFADVRRRLDDAQDAVTGFADASSIAGRACERAYDSLK